jgi:hypothetical protein
MGGQVRDMRQKCDRECSSCAVVAHNKYMQIFFFGGVSLSTAATEKKSRDDKAS